MIQSNTVYKWVQN